MVPSINELEEEHFSSDSEGPVIAKNTDFIKETIKARDDYMYHDLSIDKKSSIKFKDEKLNRSSKKVSESDKAVVVSKDKHP